MRSPPNLISSKIIPKFSEIECSSVEFIISASRTTKFEKEKTMIDDTPIQSTDKVVEPLLLDILGDRELNTIIQKCSSSEKIEIEIKVSQNGQQLLLARSLKYTNGCPCIPPQHNRDCIHRLDANDNPIC